MHGMLFSRLDLLVARCASGPVVFPWGALMQVHLKRSPQGVILLRQKISSGNLALTFLVVAHGSCIGLSRYSRSTGFPILTSLF